MVDLEFSDDTMPLRRKGLIARDVSFWLLIAIIAWAPFPLGSNRDWSWSLLLILVGLCWIPWGIWAASTRDERWEDLKRLKVPLIMAGLTLSWASIQVFSVVPSSWAHPAWSMATNILRRPGIGFISLNPWRTITEFTKLLSYIAISWIAFTLSQNESRAKLILNLIITVGALYAIYAFGLGLMGTDQYLLFYPPPSPILYLSGPFVSHNSFATFEGLCALAAGCRLVESASHTIVVSGGGRRGLITVMRFLFGKGALIIAAATLTVSALVATASRAGVFSTCVSGMATAILSTLFIKRKTERKWIVIGAGFLFVVLMVLVLLGGNNLEARIDDLIDSGNADAIRLTLWAASLRMIADAPYLGLGLGSFQDAYPMYATKMLPFIMDKAHSDYLEFAAGLGLPAAICWWCAILWSVSQMLRALFIRHKDRIYPLIGLACTILVAVHSTVDFSLQIPAVAVFYSAILGIGLAQSYPSQKLVGQPRHIITNPSFPVLGN